MKRTNKEYAYETHVENHVSALLYNDDTASTKPHCPVALCCAFGLWITSAILLTYGQSWSLDVWFSLSCIGFLFIIPALIRVAIGCKNTYIFILVGCLLALCLSGSYVIAKTQTAQHLYNTTQQALITATKDATSGLYSQNVITSIRLPSGETVTAQSRFPQDTDTICYGDTFTGTVSLSKPIGSSADFAWQSGCFLSAQVTSLTSIDDSHTIASCVLLARNTIIDTLSQIPGDESALITALSCGYRKNLSDAANQNFKVCGLAHIIAVSGAHLSLVCAFLGSLFIRFGVRKNLGIIFQLLFIVLYLILAGMPISALRAAGMTALSLCSFFAQRRPYALNALALCIITFITLDPFTALSVSFALSAGSTLGILLFSSLFSCWIRRFVPKLPRLFRDALALTFASNVVTLPLSAAWFSQVSLIAPLANALTAPLFAPLCTLSLLVCTCICVVPALTPSILSPLILFARAFLTLVEKIALIPYAAIPATIPLSVGLFCSLCLTFTIWQLWPLPPTKQPITPIRRKSRWMPRIASTLIALCILVCTFQTPKPSCELRMLDVGQGDAFLIRSNGATLLIDTGNQDSKLLQALARASVSHLDGILITHSDDDHMGSLDCLRGVVSVDTILIASDAFSCSCANCERLIQEASALAGKDNIAKITFGSVLTCGLFKLHVIWPYSYQDEGGNADSLCLLGTTDIDQDGTVDHSILFTGDAECKQIRELLDQNLVGDIDVYKVGHHGSKNALDTEIVERLKPELALISVGAHNRYGHPATKTLSSLEAYNTHVCRTDTSGDVSCEFRLDGIHVATQR